MTSTTTIIITRTTTAIPFFYDSALYTSRKLDWIPYYNTSVNAGDILNYSVMLSDDQLTMTRVISYIDEQAKADYCTLFYSAFPKYLSARSNYCNTMQHTLTVIET